MSTFRIANKAFVNSSSAFEQIVVSATFRKAFTGAAGMRASIRRGLLSTTAIVGVSAAIILATHANEAAAQQATWSGGDSTYNTGSNWSTGTAPVAAGSSALFSNAGSATVNVGSAITPDAWTFNAGAQTYTITGAAVNFGGTGITNNAASAISIANNIGGTGGLTQAGTGTLTLSGANTYTGNTTISGGTLNVAGTLSSHVSLSNSTTLRVASGGAINTTTGPSVNGNGAFTIVNLGSITNITGSNVNTNATVTLITGAGSTLSSNQNEAFSAAGANSSIVNAAGATIQGGSDTQYGRVYLGNNAAVTNYGTMAGSATLAAGSNTSGALVVGTNSTVDLRAGSTTGTVRLGNGSTLSLYTGTGTAAAGVTTIDPVTGATIILQNAGTNAAATVGAIAFGTGSTLALRGTGDGTAVNGVTGALNMSNVSGATTLSKQDSGTFVLTGSYGGALATNVTAGRLVASNTAGAFGTGTVAISNGATVELSNATANNVIELPGIAFTGAGTLEKTGAGIFAIGGTTQGSVGLAQGGLINVVAGTLRGSTQNRGSWSTNNGGLTIASGATFDGVEGTIRVDGLNGAGTLQGGATITIGVAGGNGVFTGTIQNTFTLTKAGTGTQTLSGTNTYTGGTTFGGGILNLGSASALGTAGTLSFTGGTLQYSASNQTDYSARFSAAASQAYQIDTNGQAVTFATGLTSTSGSLTKLGLGTLTLTGASTYTGATTVSNGTLAIAAGGSITSNVSNAAAFSNAGTVTGTLANSGTTTNNGVISGPVTVSGGTLTGSGSTANLTVSGGIFAPGNGTAGSSMIVNGNLALASAAQYVVQVNPGTASFTSVTGAAALGSAAVTANFASGSYVTRQYTILTAAGGRTGTFGALTKTNFPANFKANLSYDANRAFLDLTLDYTKVGGLNQNQQNVANTLTGYFNRTGGIPMAFGSLSAVGLSQVSGELGTGTQQTTFDAMGMFMGVLTDPTMAGRSATAPQGAIGYADEGRASGDAFAAMSRKAPTQFEQRWNVWAAGFGGSQTTDGNVAAGSNTATSRIYGGAAGADYRILPNTTAGFALAGGGTNFSVANGGSGRSDLFQAGGFVRHTVGATYLMAAMAYGWQDVTTDRSVGADRLNARFSTNTLSGRLEAGHRWIDPVIGMGLTPYAAAQVTSVSLPGYAEKAVPTNTFGLNYAAKDATATRSEIGLRTDKAFAVGDGVMTLRSRAAWAHNFDPDRSITATFQALPGASFVVNGAAQAREAALVTGSAEMAWLSGWTLAGTFEGEFSNVTRSYAGKGVLRYGW